MSAELQKLLDDLPEGKWEAEETISDDGREWFGCGVVIDNREILWLEGNPEEDTPIARLIAQAPTLAARVIAAEKVVEALRLALDCHGSMLLTDPPQDAWKARDVSRIGHAALAAYDEASK